MPFPPFLVTSTCPIDPFRSSAPVCLPVFRVSAPCLLLASRTSKTLHSLPVPTVCVGLSVAVRSPSRCSAPDLPFYRFLRASTMDSISQLALQRGGYDFSNHQRNVRLLMEAAKRCPAVAGSPTPPGLPPARKTGTTICGVVCKDGVVLGADTRATEGTIVADKNCSKLHRIADNMYAAGAGTSADLDHMCDWLAVQVELHRLNTNAKPRVSMAVSVLSQELFKYQGYKGCAVVLGGVDFKGPQIYKIHPHGSTDCSNFAAMGSGSLNAMAVLEAGYKDGMTLEEGKNLVRDAIKAGVLNDLGSGGNIDLCIITREGAQHLRKFETPTQRPFQATHPVFPKGTTPVLLEKIEQLKSRLEFSQEVEMVEA
ncbi:putative proteasome subunit beta type 7 precursor [Toxoplasma gondii TgCatPRC2]|uniref:proteasome endopeptidase complex n=4 Tax=Toxoplasma gondii TaxID=5811 RepID=S7W0V7_TOXGG|nr:putative proteasome subunit beta type 7 precursor [Toxoplasma gondii GT1]KAF4639066.1 putative proteasome subunit beta type 7 precursor [Toxoplasma gondii]KFG99458.1 putative proteasome subunit beta type 7 precursor [Toxoplasma gondii VAND]KYK62622.1 putative proteasome subunit beta type 7 precursor [Toxoplasma gondii TgCatPRC2]